LIVFAVKICKQCLQTASAHELPIEALTLDPNGDLRSRPSGLYPQMKIPIAATGVVTARIGLVV